MGSEPPALVRRAPILRSLAHSSYRWLWLTGLFLGFGNWMQRLTIGWLVLNETDSVFLTTAVFATRIAPNLIFGPLGGAISDRFPRKRLLTVSISIKVLVALLLWLVAGLELLPLWTVFLFVAIQGITMTFEIPSTQALVVDVVGRRDSANGIALFSVATRSVAALGAFTGGVLIVAMGPGPVFLLGALAFGLGGLAVQQVRALAAERSSTREGILVNALQGLRAIFQIRLVALLLAVAFLVEVLGFSFRSVMPSVARDVLHVGADGLGTLTAMIAAGSLVGSLGITLLSDVERKGLLIIGVIFLFGLGLLGLAGSTVFPISLVVVLVVGMMLAAFDALQWTMLQANVPDEMRGRVLGGWIFAIGFGWLGSLELGAVSEMIGVQWALAIHGAALGGLGVLTLAFSRRMRRA